MISLCYPEYFEYLTFRTRFSYLKSPPMKTSCFRAISICFIFSLLTFSGLFAQSSITVEGEITADTTWSADTVKVTGDLVINDNVILTIAPGTRVEFQGHYNIKVEGTIMADGLPGDSIIFICHPDSTASGWNGIVYNDYDGDMLDNGTSTFSYCIFEYGSARKNNVLHSRGGGIFQVIAYSGLHISRSAFRYNTSSRFGGAVYCEYKAGFVVQNCHFTQNNAPEGSAIYCLDADPEIRSNHFIKNHGSPIKLMNGANPYIVNNFIGGNETSGIYCWISNPIISGNIIVNNAEGIYIYNADPKIINNTICNNTEGLFITSQSRPVIYNTIFWGNDEQVKLGGSPAQPDLYYCNIQGGEGGITGHGATFYIGTIENIIDSDPSFVLPSAGTGKDNYLPSADWSLQVNSPCINEGQPDILEAFIDLVDYEGNPRISFTRIDIGANEFHQDFIIPPDSISFDTTYFTDTLKIVGDVLIEDDKMLTILPGTVVEFQDYYKILINGAIRAMGSAEDSIYFTVRDTTGFYDYQQPDGGWGGIQFPGGGSMYDNDTSIFKFCNFQYGKTIDTVGMPTDAKRGGAIRCFSFSRVRIENCSFINNSSVKSGGAIYFIDSDLFVINSYFEKNRSHADFGGGAIYTIRGDRTVVENNIFYNNIGFPRGGAVGFLFSEDLTLNHNVFSNNSAWRGGAICLRNTEKVLLANNLICNNSAEEGGGIYFDPSYDVSFINNTVVNNAGGGLFFRPGDPIIYNSLIWGNQPYQVKIENLSTRPNFHYSNVEGGMEAFQGASFAGEYESNLDVYPWFVNPSDSAGTFYNGLDSDWSLLSVSSCINKGTNNIVGFDIPEFDIMGQPRINGSFVDIGAVENQSIKPVVTLQPVNHIKCVGDTVVLEVRASDIVFYQWQKDEQDIPDATESILVMDSIESIDIGNYQCLLRNAYDTIISTNVFLGVRIPPEILSQPGDSWIGKDEKYSMRIFAIGTEPVYQWRKNGKGLTGENTDEIIFPSAGYGHEGSYDCIVRNACGIDSTDVLNLFVAPEICMVTVDPATGNNLVVWEKNSIAPIEYYNLYRESSYAGIYDRIGSIPKNDLSVIVDSGANPTEQAYLYKITAIDTAGYETDIDLSKTHKSIHLLVTTNPETNATQLDWDRYVGFEYGSYEIFRSETSYDFTSLHLMSSSTSTWADPEPGSTTKFYRIGAVKPEPCNPSGGVIKADSGPYSHSMSNIDDNRLQTTFTGSISQFGILEIFPNPFNQSATIRFENPSGKSYTLTITDLSGKVYRISDNITTSEFVLERKDLTQGFYFVELRGPSNYRGTIIIE